MIIVDNLVENIPIQIISMCLAWIGFDIHFLVGYYLNSDAMKFKSGKMFR